MPKAKAAATKALEIDDTLAEAHAALALVRERFDWDRSDAERECRRAIELNPNYATAHQRYGLNLLWRGQFDEAAAEIKRAQELDPLSLILNTNVGEVFYFSRQYDRAIEQYRRALELDSSFFWAHERLGRAYAQKRMYEEAIAEFQKAITLAGAGPVMSGGLGYSYAVSGRRAEAQKLLDELKQLSKQHYVWPYDIATIYAGLGENEQAFKWFEKAYEERSGWVIYLKVEPMFDSLRSDPRFQDLMRRVGLPP